MDGSVFAAIFSAIVVSYFVFCFLAINKKKDLLLDEEKLKEPFHIEIGGGRFSNMYYSRPYVKLRLYDEFLVLSYKNKILLRYDQIDTDRITRLLNGFQIYHHNMALPIKEILFFSSSADYLSAVITDKIREFRGQTLTHT